MLKSRTYTILLIFLVIVYNLFILRNIFTGKLIGEPFDSRLMISLHEHMWRWLNGFVDFRNTEFFYPYQTALGFSDVFLVQGLIYSIFRFLGFDSLSSWLNVTILLVILGNLGWVFVAKKFLKNNLIQILFIITIISSLSFVYYFTFNPNIVGYTYISWLILFMLNIKHEKNLTFKHIKISLFIIAILIYALSCWYAAFFLIFTFFLRSVVQIVITKFKFKFSINFKVMPIYLFFSPIFLYLTWLFYYVYISIATQPERSVAELIRNSPRLENIFKGLNPKFGEIEGAIFYPLYKFFRLDQIDGNGVIVGDWGGGLGIALPLLTISIIFLNIFFKKIISNYSWILAIVLTYFYFMVLLNNTSIHTYFFNSIPGFNSIRSPSRYIIFVGYAAIFVVFYYLDNIYKKNLALSKKVVIIVLLFLLALDQQRSSFEGWNRQDFINSELMSTKNEIQKNCDYFYYDKPGGWWYDQIEALSFAVQIGVPTVNGYSGAYPPGYPVEAWKSTDDPFKIFEWINKIDKSKRGCFVTGRSKIKILNSNFNSIDFVGFTGLEKLKNDSWRWANSANPYIYIFDDSRTIKKINFILKTNPCVKSQTILITDSNNNSIVDDSLIIDQQKYSIEIDMRNLLIKRIQFSTNAQACKIASDPRTLFFEMKNFEIN